MLGEKYITPIFCDIVICCICNIYLSLHLTIYLLFYLFIYLTVLYTIGIRVILQKSSANQGISRIVLNHKFQEPNSCNSMIFLQAVFKMLLCSLARYLFLCCPRTKICPTHVTQRPSHAPVRGTVPNINLLITTFSSLTLSLFHPRKPLQRNVN